jgi:hypothetical protein
LGDEARWIAANIAKLSALLRGDSKSAFEATRTFRRFARFTE